MRDVNPHIARAIDLFADRGRQAGLASAVGVSQGMVSGWLTGRYEVTLEAAIKIEEATAGAVSSHDLRPDIFGDKPSADAA